MHLWPLANVVPIFYHTSSTHKLALANHSTTVDAVAMRIVSIQRHIANVNADSIEKLVSHN